MIDRILGGDIRAIARAATAIENGDAALAAELRPHAGRALVIGVTGPPGAGKSTLVDQITRRFREEGKTVGIVAVDPTSPVSGGAILGDRVRMLGHYADPGVFIRSMATRGALGGLARATRDLVTLLDASGRDVVIVETVGVGQAEVEIARLAGVTLLVLMPGAGDEVQALKAGVMEIADIYVINKADLPAAEKLERELHEFSAQIPIVRTVAKDGTGIPELVEKIRGAGHRPARPASVPAFSVDHIGIAVQSLASALPFYEKLLGLPPAHLESVPQERVEVAMMPAGESRIELLEASSPDSTIAKFIDKRGQGLHHIALRVPDFEAAIARLKSAGARLLNEPRQGAGGHTYVFIHPASTGGVLIELIKQEQNQ